MTTAWEEPKPTEKYKKGIEFLEDITKNIEDYCMTDCIENIKSEDDRRFLYSFYFMLRRDLKMIRNMK